jgi:hypothetical protein
MLDATIKENFKESRGELLYKLVDVKAIAGKFPNDSKQKAKALEECTEYSDRKLVAEIAHFEALIAIGKARKSKTHQDKKFPLKFKTVDVSKNPIFSNSSTEGLGSISLIESWDILAQISEDYIELLRNESGYVPPMAFVISPGGGKSYVNAMNAVNAANAIEGYLNGIPTVILTLPMILQENALLKSKDS